MTEHTIRLYRRWWRRINLECIECHACLASGRSGDSWLRPEILWEFEQDHRRKASQKGPAEVHYPDSDH